MWGVEWTDVYRADGFFVYNLTDHGDNFSYDRIDQAEADRLHLKPDIGWWQRYGFFIAIPLGLLIFGVLAMMGFEFD